MGELETRLTNGGYLASLYPNLAHCKNCDTVYQAGKWLRGYYERGTTGKRNAVNKIPDNKCPICLKISN